jgi:hypothetical protein
MAPFGTLDDEKCHHRERHGLAVSFLVKLAGDSFDACGLIIP